MKFHSKKFAWSLIIIVNIIPLLIWLLMSPVGNRFSNSFQTMTSLGRISALLGFSLVATVIILAARLRFLEKIFMGLNQVYIRHHLLGSIAFMLLLFHPLILAIRYISISTKSAALFLVPSLVLWPQTLGTISLTIMMIVLFITFYLSWRYQIWKFSHRFLALASFIALFHVAFITSDISQNIFLRSYILALGGLALIAFGYRFLVEFGNFGKYDYVISGIRQLNQKILEIALKPIGKKIKYLPGQFAFLSIQEEKISEEDHPFSFVSTSKDSEIKFAIKILGDYTETLPKIKLGSTARIEGPYGSFGLGEKTKESEIWIAGGIGITPFISLAKDLKNNGRKADLYLSLHSEKEAVYLEELKTLTKESPQLKIIPHYSNVDGHISANKVEEISGPLINRKIYICGPAKMMQSLKKQFIIKGVGVNNIHTEEFSL